MVDIIGGSALLQYHLELGRSSMEDGPLSTLSIPERRERLRAYNDAWKHLRRSAYIELLNVDKCTYDMDFAPGGILTFKSRRENKIIFVQIPSNLRGIPMRQWEHSFHLSHTGINSLSTPLRIFSFFFLKSISVRLGVQNPM